jgi:hypothetical protein
VRVLITGSREWKDITVIRWALVQHAPIGATLVHGYARGADTAAAEFWQQFGPVESYPCLPADWDRYGRRAGMVRNQLMVDLGAAVCLAFIRDKSPGASACRDMALAAGIPVVPFYEGEK